ncbi:hypothetical protein HSB1_41760 [Halogranum salarium B-1]|uniref:Uncharacterized protein n=1 Tax=Halogranum salarium B-1 TaxID=1210908 RepID=J2ZWT3_9EURY|nr:hypothetical protein HSB1_41760 [Halogranum salarium B-1]
MVNDLKPLPSKISKENSSKREPAQSRISVCGTNQLMTMGITR